MNVQFGHQPQQRPPVQFGGAFFDNLKSQLKSEPAADTVEVSGTQASDTQTEGKTKKQKVKKDKNHSVARGLKRMLHKTLRPRGILELIAFPIFLPKHFIEGYFGVSSILLPRVLKLRGYHKDVSASPLVFSPLVKGIKGVLPGGKKAAQETSETAK